MIRKCNGILILCLSYSILNSCSPKLTFTQVDEKIKEHVTAINEYDAEYEFKNTPVKYLKEYGEDGYKKKIKKYTMVERMINIRQNYLVLATSKCKIGINVNQPISTKLNTPLIKHK